MDKNRVIELTKNFVKQKLETDCTGHDYWHAFRVLRIAQHIATHEKADLLTVELAALLHDVSDWKFNGGDLEEGSKVAKAWLKSLDVDEVTTQQICEIITHLPYQGANTPSATLSLEGQIVQDADRLDALGAIGIARAFAYGGHKGQPIHDPDLSPHLHDSFHDYKNHRGTSINHFYEKLLLLKDRMNTKTGKRLALEKHNVMSRFIEQFLQEWDLPESFR